MGKILIKLKEVLNTYSEDELEDMYLNVNRGDDVELIAIEEDGITLITNKDCLKFDNADW